MLFSTSEIHKTVHDFCPDAVVVANTERQIMAVNPAFEEQFGYSIEEVKGKLTRVLYECAEDFGKYGKLRYDASPSSIENRYLTRYRRKDGSTFTSETTGKAIYDGDGTHRGYVALIRDISSRIRLKEFLDSVIVLASDANSLTDAVVKNFLQAGRDYFGLESAKVTRLDQGRITTCNVIDSAEHFHVAEECELEATFCSAVVEADDVCSYHHAGAQEIGRSRCYKEQGFETYIGAPLHVSGKLSGTLSFFGYVQRSAPFTQEDKTLIQFLANWLTGFLEQREQKAELERLTDELAKTVEKARYLYRATPAMLHSIDSSHRLVEVSDYWLEKMGYAECSEVIGRPITDFQDKKMRAARTEAIKKFWKSGKPLRDRPHEFMRKDGSQFEVELSVIMANPGNEAEKQSLAVTYDVSERNRALRLLEAKNRQLEKLSREVSISAEKFKKLYRETPAMLHSVNSESELVEVSDFWLEKMGYEHRSEVLGHLVTDFLTPESSVEAAKSISLFLRTGAPVRNLPRTFVRKDGSVIETELSAVMANPISNAGGQNLVVIFDVTERNRARRELEKKNAELERLNKELDTFASVASHDLQEPLRKIRKFSEIAQDEFSGCASDDGTYALKVMHDAASRMQTLVTDVLTYSRTANTAMEIQPVDLKAVVSQVVDDLSVQIDEAGADDISCQALPVVNGDPVQIRQMFQNFIENAVRYRHVARPVKINITAQGGGNGSDMLICVSDNGMGFDQSLAELVYIPFRRLNPRSHTSGSGLGLTICARIAERHGWKLTTRSSPGEGASFTLVIPAGDIHKH